MSTLRSQRRTFAFTVSLSPWGGGSGWGLAVSWACWRRWGWGFLGGSSLPDHPFTASGSSEGVTRPSRGGWSPAVRLGRAGARAAQVFKGRKATPVHLATGCHWGPDGPGEVWLEGPGCLRPQPPSSPTLSRHHACPVSTAWPHCPHLALLPHPEQRPVPGPLCPRQPVRWPPPLSRALQFLPQSVPFQDRVVNSWLLSGRRSCR